MTRRFLRVFALFILFAAMPPPASATTWVDAEVKCPNCKKTNTFGQVMSFGSYIYSWPEKYQLVFWPNTDSQVLYSCSKCRLTLFMWDFEDVTKEELATLAPVLAATSVNWKQKRYSEIPMSERLAVAERLYEKLERDDAWWCHFRRVQAYHCDAAGDTAAAAVARRQAIELADRLIANPERAGTLKEALYIRGAMRHFLGDDVGAAKDFAEAKTKVIQLKDKPEENSKNADAFFTALIDEYIEFLSDASKAGSSPRNQAAAEREKRAADPD
ncbi:MAG: hypothetical protein IT175_09425 [Acidobacteria bacterium]|nr:hypothetical protein [Acidobacteriota bacterium]